MSPSRFRTDHAGARRALAALVFLLATTLSATARAEIAPKAQSVVERFITAIGGRASVDGIRATRTLSTVTAFGLSGSSTLFTRSPDHRASATTLGPISVSDGFDGAAGWRIDPSGNLAVLDGKDLEYARGSAWFDNDRWLAADQDGGVIAYSGEQKDSTGTYDVLEVSPPVGRSRAMWFERKSGLLSRIVMKQDQQTVTVLLSDYRAVQGRKIAFHSMAQVAGMQANTIVSQLDSVWVNEDLPDALFGLPVAEEEPVRWLRTPGTATIPFAYSGRHVWLRAAVNGQPAADFIYDTGASITVLDSAYAAGIGIATHGQMQAQGAGAAGGASFATLDSIRVEGDNGDGVVLRDRQIAVLSINAHLAPFFWRGCAGILGYDFITQFVNTLDFDAQTLTLHDPEGFAYAGAGQAIPFQLAGTMPTVAFKIDGAYEGLARVDVGSSSTIDLHAPFVKEHDLVARAGKNLEVTGGGFGGTFTNRLTRMKKIEIGPFSWDAPLVALSGATTGALASEDYSANIGNHLLERFVCTFDYARRVLYLEPGPRYAERDGFSRAGVQLVKEDGVVTAMQVLPGSPAAKAGIAEGDAVVSIDGRAIDTWTYDETRQLLEDGAVGRQVELEVRRDGKVRKIKIKLSEII